MKKFVGMKKNMNFKTPLSKYYCQVSIFLCINNLDSEIEDIRDCIFYN